jgi:hypothetical protein
MTGFAYLYIDQGADFNHIINLTDEVTNDYLDVTDFTVQAQMRRGFYSRNPSGNITCSITDAGNGEITLSMTSANTSNLKPGRHVFDIKTIDTEDTVSRILEGIITVNPSVTR